MSPGSLGSGLGRNGNQRKAPLAPKNSQPRLLAAEALAQGNPESPETRKAIPHAEGSALDYFPKYVSHPLVGGRS